MSEGTILTISSIPFLDDCDFYIKLGDIGRTSWSLSPRWTKTGQSGELVYLEIFRTTSAGRVELEIKLVYYLLSGDKFSERTFKTCFEEGQKSVRIISSWPENFEDGEKLKGTVTIYDSIRCLKCAIKSPEEQTTISHLSDDFLLLFNNPDLFPDATLKCGTVEIPVHKNILSVRSPVFAAMFKSEMQESRGVVDIVDIEEGVLKAVLKFIYSGKTDLVTDELAGDLLFAADKYQLEELKLICIGKLKSSTTVNNVSRTLVLGNLHDESLKCYAKEFIDKYATFSELEKTEEWSVLEREHPELAIEVLKSVVMHTQEHLN